MREESSSGNCGRCVMQFTPQEVFDLASAMSIKIEIMQNLAQSRILISFPCFYRTSHRSTFANGGSADDPGTAFAEADRRIAVAPAMGAENHLVAVLEKRSGLAVV